MQYKLGKKPFEPNPKDFQLKTFSVSLPPLPPKPFGYAGLYTDWGMLGNDDVGDCVLAGGDHETMLYNKLAKHEVSFTRANALADYSAITGYDPNDPNTDQGTYPRDAMNYRRTTGLIDANGKRHKIDAFVSIPAGDFDLMIRCVWTFGAVGIGFNFPASAMDQFNNGEPWDVVSGSPIEGGHYVPMFGYPSSTTASCVTWGKRQVMTKAFYEKYNDESWVPLTKESLLPATNVRHIDWTTLSAELNTL
jgi:hypothetical protein